MYGTTFTCVGRWPTGSSCSTWASRPTDIFAASTLAVSLLVSWFWNFALQRYFVYRPSKFDPYAIALVNFLGFRKRKTQNN